MRTDTEILHVQDFPLTIPQGTYAQIAFVVEQVEKKQSDYNQENWHFTFLPVDQISIGILENTLEPDAIFIEPATMDLVKAEKLSELLGKHEIPFILYTEKFDLTAKQKAIELKLDDYLFGAFTPALLKRLQFIKKIKAYKLNRNPKTYQPVKIQPTESIKIWKLKRFSDIFLASLAIVLLSPLLIVIALIIKLESKGPIFYISKRAGSGYKIFDFYKFRSMHLGADQELKDLSHLNQYNNTSNDHVFFKIKDDPRVTPFGLFLRNSSLDELPQLFNVLKGDMSLVGNRPLPLYEAERLTKDQIAWRFVAPAGITGLWQVTKRGQKDMSLDERIHLDMEYAMKNSFLMDMKIIFSTFPALFQKEKV